MAEDAGTLGAEPITRLLRAYEHGDAAAFSELARLIYPQLKAMARAKRRAAAGPRALGATTLVHEAYLKILGGAHSNFADRRHFFAVAATAMRQVVLDQLRTAAALKRQGQDVAEDALDEMSGEHALGPAALTALEQGIAALEAEDAQALRVFECKYFAGYSTTETAEALGLSVRTVERCWTQARKFLAKFVI